MGNQFTGGYVLLEAALWLAAFPSYHMMGYGHNDRSPCSPSTPEGIPIEGVSTNGIANRPRSSTISMRGVGDNNPSTVTTPTFA